MLAKLRPRLNHATVVAYLALFVALGGGAYAASLSANSVSARQIQSGAVGQSEIKSKAVGAPEIKTGGVRGAEIKTGSIVSSDIKNSSLVLADFKPSQLPAGPRGPAGATKVVTRTSPQQLCSTDGCEVPANVSCNAGEVATGGGGYTVADNYLTTSAPIITPTNPTPKGWQTVAKDESGTGDTGSNVVAMVVCASP